MTDKIHSTIQDVEDSLACTAFAEEGIVCPLGTDQASVAAAPSPEGDNALQEVEDTLTCAAFAEEGEECPLRQGK
ncbi:MAG: hypothetical protein ACOY3Z_02590 [Thermodesulfobacteriota bacterium]